MKSIEQKDPIFKYIERDSAKSVANTITKGCRLIGLTRGQFSLIDLIYSTLQVTGKANVICATWSAGIKDANTVKWMVDSDLIESFLLCTDHSYVTRQKKYCIQLLDLFGKDNIRTSEMHAKFCLIYNDSYKIAIRTSMNLNANKTCESFEIDENENVFNFYNDFIKEIFGEMPAGFVADSKIVNRGLSNSFSNLKNEFAWSNE